MEPDEQPVLPIGRYLLAFRARGTVHLPTYAGSAWRGAFGSALRRLVCVAPRTPCPQCMLYRTCVYPYVFETPPDPAAGKMRRYTAAPHPFVLAPGEDCRGTLAEGATTTVGLTLFGRGNGHLPYLVRAFEKGGARGIGEGGGRLDLAAVRQLGPEGWQEIRDTTGRLTPLPISPPPVPACPDRVTLCLETPLRLKVEGRNLTPERFAFGPLFSNLLRRISMLTTFHTDHPLETDFAGLTAAARAVEVTEARLRWHDWTRYSSRQDTLMKMGGLVGTVVLDGTLVSRFWPYLWLGQWTHAGKGTSMGLGRYRIEGARIGD